VLGVFSIAIVFLFLPHKAAKEARSKTMSPTNRLDESYLRDWNLKQAASMRLMGNWPQKLTDLNPIENTPGPD